MLRRSPVRRENEGTFVGRAKRFFADRIRELPCRVGEDELDPVLLGPDPLHRGLACASEYFEALDQRLGGSEYVAGNRFNVADITAIAMFDFAGWVGSGPTDAHSNTRRWRELVNRRPSVSGQAGAGTSRVSRAVRGLLRRGHSRKSPVRRRSVSAGQGAPRSWTRRRSFVSVISWSGRGPRRGSSTSQGVWSPTSWRFRPRTPPLSIPPLRRAPLRSGNLSRW
ncbi:MAG TPA: hypothetical protein ENI85_08195 [Deltaproteobacteria bacterium]|nr:hypothetical protein [Deltaproteobacteria bacterium]